MGRCTEGTISARAARWNTQSTFRNKGRILSASLMLASCISKWGDRERGSKFADLPVEKLSITTTRLPSLIRQSARWLPIKPAPPVMRVFIVRKLDKSNRRPSEFPNLYFHRVHIKPKVDSPFGEHSRLDGGRAAPHAHRKLQRSLSIIGR